MRLLALLWAMAGLLVAPPPDDDPARVVIHLRVAPDDARPRSAVVGELSDGQVVEISVSGADAHLSAEVRQCVRRDGRPPACWNEFPVQFGAGGATRFQYELDDRDCGPDAGCLLVVADDDGLEVVAHTVFGAPAPAPPVVELSPAGPYEVGAPVTVTVTGVQAGGVVSVGWCDPQCEDLQSVPADASGAASAVVEIGERCRGCGVLVASGASETFVVVRFAPVPTASYDVGRLLGGLALALALLVVAWRVIVTVDWRPPSEAATPDLDAAEL